VAVRRGAPHRRVERVGPPAGDDRCLVLTPHCPVLRPLLARPPQQQQQPLRPGDGESTNATAGEYAEEVEKEEAPNDCESSPQLPGPPTSPNRARAPRSYE